ncbi:transmembrane protein 255B isoform X11 [Callithrix jacchus]|uniref:transmembrane protein 255B isoform X11 n=1 Tax=Callithrix jacchus TaxID=9483 RepID=UPI00159DFB3C|nr:transmembrane protein 255B isoform X11 [Callithrix jacchus]
MMTHPWHFQEPSAAPAGVAVPGLRGPPQACSLWSPFSTPGRGTRVPFPDVLISRKQEAAGGGGRKKWGPERGEKRRGLKGAKGGRERVEARGRARGGHGAALGAGTVAVAERQPGGPRASGCSRRCPHPWPRWTPQLVAAIVFISFGVVAAFCCAIVDGVFAARHIVTCHSLNGKCQLKCGTLTRLLRVRRRPQLPGRPAPVPPALGLCSSEHFGPVPGDHHRRHPGGLQGHGASVPDGLWPGRPSTDPLQPCPADSGLRRLPPDARARPDLLILPSAPSGLQMFRKDSCSRHMTLKEQAILRVTSGGGLCTTPPSCPGCRGLRFEWGPRAMTSANPGDLHQGRSGNWHAWNWGCWGSLASRAC